MVSEHSPRGSGLVRHDIFEATAKAWPDNAAVVSGRQTATYGELNARANQLARYLRKRDVKRGKTVPNLPAKVARVD
jgi:non-ribosomal peptide synthetase component F